MKNKFRFRIYGIETRRTLILAGPIILGQVGQVMLGVVDSIMVGHLGAVPLAASALANSIMINFLVFGFGLSSCISVLTSRAYGAEQHRECGEVLRHGIVINAVVAVAMVAVLEVLIPFAVLLNQPPDVVAEMTPFLRLITFSMIPALIGHGFKGFSEGLGDSLRPMIVFLSAIPLNGFLNWIMIYGKLGFPEMGLEGAGLATLLTRIIGMLWLMYWVLSDQRKEPYRPIEWFAKFRKSRIFEMMRVGIPAALQVLFEVGAFSFSAIMMGWLGTQMLAAHQIAINLASLVFMVPMGLSFAVAVRVGGAAGANNWKSAQRIGYGAMLMSLFFAAFFTVIFIVGRNFLPTLYIEDTDVVALAAQLILVAGIFQFFDGLQVVSAGALRGLLDLKVPTIITFIAYWGLALPLGYIGGFKLDEKGVGVWMGLCLGLAFAALTLGWRFRFLSRRQVMGQGL